MQHAALCAATSDARRSPGPQSDALAHTGPASHHADCWIVRWPNRPSHRFRRSRHRPKGLIDAPKLASSRPPPRVGTACLRPILAIHIRPPGAARSCDPVHLRPLTFRTIAPAYHGYQGRCGWHAGGWSHAARCLDLQRRFVALDAGIANHRQIRASVSKSSSTTPRSSVVLSVLVSSAVGAMRAR